MIVLPEILATERTARGVHLRLNVAADLCYFEGHFPEVRLLPGVVQVTWAIEFGRALIPFEGRFRALNAVKFMRVIQPDTIVTLDLDYEPASRELTFAFRLGAQECSNGAVLFDG